MEIFFYTMMVVFGVVYALIVTNPKEKENQSFSMRYPLLGVFAFFSLLLIVYYLLTLADKNIMQSYLGSIALLASYLATSAIYRRYHKK